VYSSNEDKYELWMNKRMEYKWAITAPYLTYCEFSQITKLNVCSAINDYFSVGIRIKLLDDVVHEYGPYVA